MNKLITYETIRNFTYSNDKIVDEPIRGIVLEFTGLGTQDMIWEDYADARMYAKQGIICVRPYYNPWSWMNRQTVSFVDEIIDVLVEHYRLPKQTPIVASGGSMGGLCALVYTHYAKHTPAACVTNCPVCDLPYHFTERVDLPRTLYSAFGEYKDMTMEEALETASPVHLAATMPHIPYSIFHCNKDMAVNIDLHSRKFLEAMSEHNVSFYEVEGRGHCDLTEEMRYKYIACILKAFD